MQRTQIYVDGFNLYYGALKSTPYRWLDLARLCRRLLPTHDVTRINYYTARVRPRLGDGSQVVRQQTYLRALRTQPLVHAHFGHYLSHPVWMPLASPPLTGSRFVRVIRTDEKGSDVNLATHLVRDAYEDQFDAAVLITNDSDLVAPVDLVRHRLGKRVGVLNPHRHPATALAQAATFIKTIRSGVLRASQFPETLTDAAGTFSRPPEW